MVFWEFLTSWWVAWLPMYCSRVSFEWISATNSGLTISSPKNDTAHAIWRSPSSLAMHSASPSCTPIRISIFPIARSTPTSQLTFVNTAIEAKESPKLIPTTDGKEETSIGASAVPFGTFLGAIFASPLDVIGRHIKSNFFKTHKEFAEITIITSRLSPLNHYWLQLRVRTATFHPHPAGLVLNWCALFWVKSINAYAGWKYQMSAEGAREIM
jgi:hypothetical protein